MRHSALRTAVVFAGLLLTAGQSFAACSFSGSSFQFVNFPVHRDELTIDEREQLAQIGAQARAEGCSITVTAVAPQNADKQAFDTRFRQSYVAREALVWRVGTGQARVRAMEAIARYDVKAQLGRFKAGTVYINIK